jgi:hypothetical protein
MKYGRAVENHDPNEAAFSDDWGLASYGLLTLGLCAPKRAGRPRQHSPFVAPKVIDGGHKN